MLTAKVLSAIRRQQMLRPGDCCVVAVSGGPDSIALLHLLDSLRQVLAVRLVVAHLNHKLRGGESDQDEAFVADTANRLGLPFVCERLDVAAQLKAGENLESRARQMRYRFLRAAAAEHQAGRIATGHTRNDQAETVLMKLIRGAGEEGLAGIFPIVDDLIIRPLLEIDREEIEAFLRQQNLDWRTDSSNQSQHFLRNRVRTDLIPHLQRLYNPRIVAALARTAEIRRQDARVLADWADAWIGQRKPFGPGAHISLQELRQQPLGLRRHIFGRLLGLGEPGRRLSWTHRQQLERLLEDGHSGRQVELPGGWVARREFDTLIFETGGLAVAPFARRWAIPGDLHIPEMSTRLRARLVGRREAPVVDPALQVWARVEATGSELWVRPWKPGDRYSLDAGREPRKLKDIFQDRRVPRSVRGSVPVILSGDSIVWVPGVPVAAPFQPLGSDMQLLVLEKIT